MTEHTRSAAAVLVADDDPALADLLATTLAADGHEPLVARTGLAALAAVESRELAAAVLDVNLPDVSGYELCRALRERYGSRLPIVFVSGARLDPLDRLAGLLIGADDYLPKPFAPEELTLRLRRLLTRGYEAAPAPLTGREQEVLELLAAGLDQAAIAARLVISPRTVATHIERILGKLGVHSRAQAVALAYRLELVPT